jgi:signal transduction histidine kinase
MTKRLAFVIVSVVLATLVLAGFGSLVVGNLRARQTTRTELRDQAEVIAANLEEVLDTEVTIDNPAALRRRVRWLNVFRNVLDLDGLAVITINRNGQVSGDDLPPGVTMEMLGAERLRNMEVIVGNRGNLVYAAAPSPLPGGGVVVVVLSREANAALGASWRTFILAAMATLAIGVLVSIVLGRRLTKPIREASAATQKIAHGDLATRLPEPPPGDHDELAELARSVNTMATELQRAQVLEQQFLLSVSHDLRTPLTSIRGYAEAISDGAADPQRSAAVIQNEARRLERLVADLLDLAKLRAAGFSLRAERVDLVALAVVTAEAFRPDAGERNLEMNQVGQGQLMVSADHDRLSQVAANLVENALKYARFQVTITASRDDRWGVLAVDDDGPGIAAADLPHVFDRLYVARSQPSRRENSSGLGLAIVRELVDAMGGSVVAAQSPSGGARLVVRLPLLLMEAPV